MNANTYTRIFLTYLDLPLTLENVNQKLFVWWTNPRQKKDGGLRLTNEGKRFLKDYLKLKSYEIPFPKGLDLKPKVLVQLDQFIDCPYHLTKNSITVFDELKAIELLLFAGDVKQYGISYATQRKSQLLQQIS